MAEIERRTNTDEEANADRKEDSLKKVDLSLSRVDCLLFRIFRFRFHHSVLCYVCLFVCLCCVCLFVLCLVAICCIMFNL